MTTTEQVVLDQYRVFRKGTDVYIECLYTLHPSGTQYIMEFLAKEDRDMYPVERGAKNLAHHLRNMIDQEIHSQP